MPSALITSRANPRVRQLRAAFAGSARLSDGLIAVEGENLICEAIRSGITPRTVFLSERTIEPGWLPNSIEVLRLQEAIFASAADTQAPQGIAALVQPPQWPWDTILLHASALVTTGHAPLFLVAAGLQDPGNLGTLIRAAEAFAATAVLTTPGTVSPWNPKALRASAGSVFRVPVVGIKAANLAALKSRGIRLFAAVALNSDSARARPRRRAEDQHSLSAMPDLTRPLAVMIGNEGAGLAPDLLALADARISIPTPGPVESLNAAIAGSLLLYEASRQRQTPRTSSPEPRT